MMKKTPNLGAQELEIMKYVSENAPVPVREVALHFEKARGLARTTVLTVMERLRKKGLLERTRKDGVFQYSAKIKTKDLLTQRVSDFVEKTLGGSLSPLLSHFISNPDLTETEIKSLKDLAAKLDANRGRE